MSSAGLKAMAISKRFGAFTALDDVSLTLRPGTIHGVLGENGAGKSTLMKILAGLLRPDAGAITTPCARSAGSSESSEKTIRSVADARAAGVGMVHQHFMLVPTLSVLDNCVLAAGRGLGRIDRAGLRVRLHEWSARTGLLVDPDARAGDLAVGQQQRVEILKALLGGGRVLILDEPTAVLTPQEVDELIPALKALAASGTAVAFISHKLHEVERLCDEVTILRRGRVVHDGPCAELSRARMAELVLGAVPPPVATRAAVTLGPEQLVLQQVSMTTGTMRDALHAVDLRVYAGETVGIAGVDGNGQATLTQVILGLCAPSVGTVTITAARVGVIPDDRQREALVMDLNVRDNLLLKDGVSPPFAHAGWLRGRAWTKHARTLIERFKVSPRRVGVAVAALSGGNQQKVVIARELHGEPGLVVAVNPTRGLDVGAAAAVWTHLANTRARGAGVLLIHADLDELLAVADRVLVLSGGRLRDSGWPDCTRADIGRLMLEGSTPNHVEATAHA